MICDNFKYHMVINILILYIIYHKIKISTSYLFKNKVTRILIFYLYTHDNS